MINKYSSSIQIHIPIAFLYGLSIFHQHFIHISFAFYPYFIRHTRHAASLQICFPNIKSRIGIVSSTPSTKPRNGNASNKPTGDNEFAYSSTKPRSGDALVAPSRPSGGETKIDRREIFVRRCEGGMGLNVIPANVGVEDVGQRNRNSKSIEKNEVKIHFYLKKIGISV